MADDPHGLLKMSDKELREWTAGRKPTTEKHAAGLKEISRRKEARSNLRTWAAIGMSALSLAVSIVALTR